MVFQPPFGETFLAHGTLLRLNALVPPLFILLRGDLIPVFVSHVHMHCVYIPEPIVTVTTFASNSARIPLPGIGNFHFILASRLEPILQSLHLIQDLLCNALLANHNVVVDVPVVLRHQVYVIMT